MMPILEHKAFQLCNGHKIITNDDELDKLQEMLNNWADKDGREADYIRTIPNPNRLGVLDQYLGWIA